VVALPPDAKPAASGGAKWPQRYGGRITLRGFVTISETTQLHITSQNERPASH
jgi:hypothetical protein